MTPIAWIGVIALTIASSVSAEAASLESKELVAKLVSEHKVAARGRTTTVMVHQKMAPGWHTYWRNPGDSGQAPTIQWDLPEGVTVTPAAWPAPRRIAYGPLVNYGYKDESALLFDVAVPADWPDGRPLALRAEAEILVCAQLCIPLYGQLALDIPTGAKSVTATEAAPLFARMRARQPAPAPWPATVQVTPKRLTLLLHGAKNEFGGVTRAYLFPRTWGLIQHAAPQELQITSKGLSLSTTLGDATPPAAFSGVITLFRSDGGHRSYVLADRPMTVGTSHEASR